MEFIVDTCIVIDYFQKKPQSSEVFRRLLKSHSVFFSSITVFELYVGIKPETRRSELLDALVELVRVLSFDTICAKEAADIERDLRDRGEVISPKDIMIAATGIVHDMPILTSNIQHFNRLKTLVLYDAKSVLDILSQ